MRDRTRQSVPRLFLAGILPGILQAAVFFIWVMYYARKHNFPVETPAPFNEKIRQTLRALPAMIVPIIVLVGIYGGFVTVTEAAALSAVAALVVSLFFYKGFHWTKTLYVIADGMRSAAAIMLIVATALALGHYVTESGIPAQLVKFAVNSGFSTWQFLLIINVLLLVVGCFLEVLATLLLIHPPVGLNLFVLSTITSASVGEVIKGIFPFLILLLFVLGIISYVPALTMWLPNLVFGAQ